MIRVPFIRLAGSSPVLPANRQALVTVVDVGSTKVCCVIARLTPRPPQAALSNRTHTIEVLGFGQRQSHGIKSGVIVDLDQAEQSIRHAVDAAEQMAGFTVESVIVNVSCGRVGSDAFSASVSLNGHPVEQSDIQRVLHAGHAQSVRDGRAVIHSLPIGYSMDGNRGIEDPIGMVGGRLGVNMHVVTAESAPLRNLEVCIERCHLEVEGFVATPFAAGLSTLVDDEAELGAACIDFGGGTTNISIFADGEFVHAASSSLGGNHITMDIARGLSTKLTVAERLKTLHGSALPSAADDRDLIAVPPVSGDTKEAPSQIPRSALTRIIRPRMEEILEVARDKIAQSGFGAQVGKRIIITGGASELTGAPEVARRILARNVRLGRPLGLSGMPSVAKGAAFSVVAGLLIYPQVAQFEHNAPAKPIRLQMTGTGGYIAKVSQWLKESF